MSRPALKLIERTEFFEDRGEFWSGADLEHHSLHAAVSYPDSFKPQLPRYFIERYSGPGDVVLDPFVGRGTSALEAALLGRVALYSDINPLAVRITRAKLEPVDLTQVVLKIPSLSLKRLASLDGYGESFAPFYHPDTYRELLNLRDSIAASAADRAARFVEMVALGLLHGHTAGFFSAYTFPQVALTPQAQRELNAKRKQSPEYRAVAPRILRRTAALMRDGGVGQLELTRTQHRSGITDARKLDFVKSASVNLVVTAPPMPGAQSWASDMWLKLWFLGLSSAQQQALSQHAQALQTVEQWLDFMNQTLVELARVVKSGGRAVLDLRERRLGQQVLRLDRLLVDMIGSELARFWDAECLVCNVAGHVRGVRLSRTGPSSQLTQSERVLVLRRR